LRVILVTERKHLFPGLSPQGFLPPEAIDLDSLTQHLFFAERDYMEQNSHYKQLIPYLLLQRGSGDDRRILCYSAAPNTRSSVSAAFGRSGSAATWNPWTGTTTRCAPTA